MWSARRGESQRLIEAETYLSLHFNKFLIHLFECHLAGGRLVDDEVNLTKGALAEQLLNIKIVEANLGFARYN